MEDKKEEVKFYDEYVDRQVDMGINHRHLSIQEKLIKSGLKSTDRVLEIGAGIGTVTELILRVLKNGELVANDLSPRSIEIAEKRLSRYDNVELISGNVLECEFSIPFDVIVLPDVLEHIPKKEHNELFKKMRSVLKENGWIFIHIPNPFYLDYIRAEKPHLLQKIDQSLSLSHLSNVIEENELYIDELKNYSIYVRQNDYQYLIVRSVAEKTSFDPVTPKKMTYFERVLRKIRGV